VNQVGKREIGINIEKKYRFLEAIGGLKEELFCGRKTKKVTIKKTLAIF